GLQFFSDRKRAAKALADLAQGRASFHIAPRTRQIFRKLRPVLLEWLTKAADPDATLNQFVRFVEAYGLRSLLFELLVANPRLLFLSKLLANEQLTLIALGKFVGRQVGSGEDLYVLFVCDDTRCAQNVIVAMAQPTPQGNFWAFDATLRPDGEKGPPVSSRET